MKYDKAHYPAPPHLASKNLLLPPPENILGGFRAKCPKNKTNWKAKSVWKTTMSNGMTFVQKDLDMDTF